jgi:hypothetical protein
LALSVNSWDPMRSSRPPNPEPERRWGKWLVLALLAGLAAFMYLGIMVKISKFGF